MFRLNALVEDKNVVKVLHALTGMVGDLTIVPVVNAKVVNGKVQAETNGSSLDLFAKWLKGKAGISINDVRGFCSANGMKESSANYILKRAREAHLLKARKGKGGYTYHPV